MPQTLTKPVMLDETGQDISSKINGVSGKLDTNGAAIVDALDDIKDAIGTSSEFIPIMIKVITPPTKTTYSTGEALDLTGLSVSLVASNGAMADVTGACTFSPANGATLTSADTAVNISFYYMKDDYTFTTSVSLTIRSLTSISVTNPPTKTTYFTDETLDLTGITVTALYDDGYTENVTSSCTFSPANGSALTTSDTGVTITYTESGITKTATQAITVKELSSIAITTPPPALAYHEGDTLDLTGIVITATFSDSSTEVVTSSCIFSPANGATLTSADTTLTVTYSTHGVTKTTTSAIVFAPYIYGIKRLITSSDSEWTRTDDAVGFTFSASNADTQGSSSFDSCYPWSEMQRETDSLNNVFVRIPKFWFKRYIDNDNYEHIQISTAPWEGFTLHPAFDKGGTQYDYILVGAYVGTDDSKAGMSYYNYATHRDNLRTWAAAKGYYLLDVATYSAIEMLLLVEVADWNVQSKIGIGVVLYNSDPKKTGACDNLPTLTGRTGASNNDDGNQAVVWRGLENLWSYAKQALDGLNYYQGRYFICNDPSNYADNTDTNYTQLGYTSYAGGDTTGFVKSVGYDSNNPAYMLVNDIEANGTSGTTYITDKSSLTGGSTGSNWFYLLVGAFSVSVSNATEGLCNGLESFTYTRIGIAGSGGVGRMLKLPTT